MDLIKHIIVEMRPRLCSCSVVIITNTSLSEKSLNISIRPNYIIINYSDSIYIKKKSEPRRQKELRRDSSSSYESYSDSEDEKYTHSQFVNISSYCKLIPNSLSSLKIEHNFMSFRILTEPVGPNSSGTVYNEVFSIENDINRNSCSLEKLPIFLKEKVSVRLQCVNCSSDLFTSRTDSVLSFDRILELPSDNIDMSDWFCHKHDHDDKNEASNSKSSLVPSASDIFYGLGYFLINCCVIQDRVINFNKKRDFINCDRCFLCLGIKVHKVSCCKFWDSCVKFVEDSKSHESFHFFHKVTQTESNNVALENFLYIIRYAIKNSIIDSINSSCKIILECKVSTEKNKSMLIWVMDKNLQILKTEFNNILESNRNEIKINDVFTSKLLYKCDDGSEVLQKWSNDPCIQNFEISKDMFVEGNKHLNEMSGYIPFSFRKSNEFFVTYLKI